MRNNNMFEITKQQAELFLELLTRFECVSKENNILAQYFGDIKVGLFDTYVLKKKLEEFVGV